MRATETYLALYDVVNYKVIFLSYWPMDSMDFSVCHSVKGQSSRHPRIIVNLHIAEFKIDLHTSHNMRKFL